MKILFIVLVGLYFVGCSSVSRLGNEEDVWVSHGGDVYYCRANKNAKNEAYPTCVEASAVRSTTTPAKMY